MTGDRLRVEGLEFRVEGLEFRIETILNMQTIQKLRHYYFAMLAVVAGFAILYETDLLPSGRLSLDPAEAYIVQIFSILFTLVAIPVALKFLHFSRIRERIHESEEEYFKWSLYRMGILTAVLQQNTIFYYELGFEVFHGYLALMSVVPFLFIWPSEDKMNYERQITYDKDEA